MTKLKKVIVGFLIVGILAALLSALYLDIQERRRYYKEYRDTILSLSDSINSLKRDLVRYEKEIAKLDKEKDSIRTEIKVIFRDNEKVDAYLANGDWSDNIKFLTDFLSKEDSVSE